MRVVKSRLRTRTTVQTPDYLYSCILRAPGKSAGGAREVSRKIITTITIKRGRYRTTVEREKHRTTRKRTATTAVAAAAAAGGFVRGSLLFPSPRFRRVRNARRPRKSDPETVGPTRTYTRHVPTTKMYVPERPKNRSRHPRTGFPTNFGKRKNGTRDYQSLLLLLRGGSSQKGPKINVTLMLRTVMFF